MDALKLVTRPPVKPTEKESRRALGPAFAGTKQHVSVVSIVLLCGLSVVNHRTV